MKRISVRPLLKKTVHRSLCLLAGVTSDRAASIDRLTPRVLGQAVRIGAAVELAQVLYTKFQTLIFRLFAEQQRKALFTIIFSLS